MNFFSHSAVEWVESRTETMEEFKILTSEPFEHLPHAPIIEAIIDFRTKASRNFELSSLQAELTKRLPEYPSVAVHNTCLTEVKIVPGQSSQAEQRDIKQGLQFKSADGNYVATFQPEGFTFSRLPSYEDWDHLRNEAFRLWRVHEAVVAPGKVERIGLRYINRFYLPKDETRFEDYINCPPLPPKGMELPYLGFLHVDTLQTPGYPYTINIIRTIQAPQPPLTHLFALIIDIDVFTLQVPEFDDIKWLEDRLSEMRWLKNKAFFGLITPKALENFR
jgi:uncharacterized protein (TIGR04255 family)